MKIAVGIFISIFVLFMSFVFIGGFLQKHVSESSQTTQNGTPRSRSVDVTQTYSTAEVAKHGTASNCWLIINNSVYDVTSFLGEHPGGASTIIPYCGKEATRAFDTQDRGARGGQHSQSAVNMLDAYLIGTIQ